jgi:NAD(P)-dependent dehydrogenase (short-subunit alcohol dehydrogenase family)
MQVSLYTEIFFTYTQKSFADNGTKFRRYLFSGTGGSILFIFSVTGHQAHKNLAAYGMSKAGPEMLAKIW